MKEWSLIKNSAPGEDDVRIGYIRNADEHTRLLIARKLKRLIETPSENWDTSIKTGLVVPIFKKGDRRQPQNYRGVCLLAMASRILARILATRLREWTESIKILGEAQQGFRTGRSTTDAAQIFVRIHEEMERTFSNRKRRGEPNLPRGDDPVAILLDLKKAYPRVNRPCLWSILRRLGALREGCATSPVLFNIFHAVTIQHAAKKRTEANPETGIKWQWRPGNALPPHDLHRAVDSTVVQNFLIEHSLFADDTTFLGTRKEIDAGVKTAKSAMEQMEERCNDENEERMELGKEGGTIRMLGSYADRRHEGAIEKAQPHMVVSEETAAR